MKTFVDDCYQCDKKKFVIYKKLNVCISDNLDFVAIHYSIHVLDLGGASFLLLFLLQIVGDQVENALPYA